MQKLKSLSIGPQLKEAFYWGISPVASVDFAALLQGYNLKFIKMIEACHK